MLSTSGQARCPLRHPLYDCLAKHVCLPDAQDPCVNALSQNVFDMTVTKDTSSC